MATVNNRIKNPQALTINSIAAGGLSHVTIQQGYDNIMATGPDGLAVPVRDREIAYTRGSIVSEDWVHVIELLTGAVGTGVFYARKSGVAAATGYLKYTLTAPVIHRMALSVRQGGYATIAFDFECRAADPAKTFADMLAITDSQAVPTYVAAARGGYRIETAVHGVGTNIYHVTALDFALAMRLVKACNDGDVGYTCVDCEVDGMAASGSLTIQDASIASSTLLSQRLLALAAADLVVTVTQSAGAADKVITIANVTFDSAEDSADSGADFSSFRVPFGINNDVDTPLTLSGTDKILAVA